MSHKLVVMGMSRHAALKRLLSGSVASEVLRRIECDVLIASPAAVERVRSTIGGAHMAQHGPMRRTAKTLLNETETTA